MPRTKKGQQKVLILKKTTEFATIKLLLYTMYTVHLQYTKILFLNSLEGKHVF